MAAMLLRSKVLPIGMVFLVLGLGNWSISHNKITEYTQRSRAGNSVDSVTSFGEFPKLNARTNTMVLERLRHGPAEYTFTDAKLDFYKVVEGGGRTLALMGLALIGMALVQSWREARGAAERGDPADTSPS